MSYRDKLTELGIDVYKVRGKIGKTTCPKCSHTRKKKTDPCLSVSIEEGFYKCHNCDWHGSVKYSDKPKREFTRPKIVNQTDCDDFTVQWFAAERGISQNVLIKNKIMVGETWMPQLNAKVGCVQFPYFRKGELINIKHRDINKNFRLEKDAELIMYGLDDLSESGKYIIIVEGEICKLSWNEAGIWDVLSVPNGASKQKIDGSPMDLDYIDACWEYFDNDKIIILATDNDTPGIILRDELSRRFGRDRCRKINLGDVKDSNDYLKSNGPAALRDLIKPENLIEYPIAGIVEVDDIWDDVNVIMEQGLSRGITTGVFRNFDDHFSFEGSKLCVVTGIPNSGKSPFVDQLVIILSIRYGWKWGICSMENKPLKLYITKLVEKVYGQFIRPGKVPTVEIRNRIKNFIADHFFFIEANDSNGEAETLDFILSTAKSLVRKHGIKGLVIDPWNKIEHEQKSGDNETNYVSRALDKIIKFGQVHDLFTFLVAHPAKPRKNKMGEYEVPDLYSVSGSANFYNKPDFGITVHRNYESGLTEIHITKMKWDHLGKRGVISFKYNGGNGRLYETLGGSPDFSLWLDSLLLNKFEAMIEEENFENDGTIPDDAPF